jgi:hypothetical protein
MFANVRSDGGVRLRITAPGVLDLPEGKLTNLTLPRGFGGVAPERRKFTMFTLLRVRARQRWLFEELRTGIRGGKHKRGAVGKWF